MHLKIFAAAGKAQEAIKDGGAANPGALPLI